MPLAAPLILPFAELAGITIAGLGMAAASQKVSDFISANPEASMEILNMIVPGSKGLETLFKKKASVTLEDVEDMTDEEAADLSKEDKAEIMKEVGKSKGGDKRQRMIDISEKLGLSGEGKEKQTIIDEVEERYDEGGVEDAPKPKFDYKKFFRNRNADGGAIGIEALFTDKKPRKNFSTGGDEQRKIADDEYYASLQNIIERDPGAKEFFNPDDITYPAMDKSGNYNYKGVQVQTDDLDKFKKYAEKRGLDQILSPESTFKEKIKEGQYPVGIFERPVETGTEPMDLRKMQTILHEARHKIMMKPEFRKIMDKYLLKEETFVRYLDKEFFPELDAYLPDFVNPEEADKTYKKAVEEYKDKFTKEDKGFINRLKNLFADGGAIGIEVLFEEKKDGGRIGFANGGIENIIGKNLDNVTNVAKGLDKEFLDMTYPNKYYQDVIQPAKLGQRPIPSRMEMLSKFQPVKAMRIGMDPYLPSFMGGGKYAVERAQPTAATSKFLNTIGKGAKFAGTKVGPLSFMDLFASTPLGADDEVTDEMRQSIEMSPTSTTDIMVDANEGFRTSPRTNVQGMDLEADLGTRINPDIQPQQNIFQRAGNVFSSIKDNIPNFGILGLLNNLDQFDSLPIEDRQFILDQAGGNRPNKDPFGINIRSAFGNYADYVRNKGIFAPGKRGEYYRSLNIPGLDTAMKETVAREQRAKRAYEKQIRDAADAAARDAARARSISAGYGGYDYSSGATGATAAGAGMGVGGGYASDYFGADGGSVPTGLATMFTRKR